MTYELAEYESSYDHIELERVDGILSVTSTPTATASSGRRRR
jgi:hypothetical protein